MEAAQEGEARRMSELQEQKLGQIKRQPLSATLRAAVYERDSTQCQECKSIERLHIHHVIHVQRGGKNELDNLITLCRSCHLRRHGFKEGGGNHTSKTLSLDEDTWADWDNARKKYGSYNKALRALLLKEKK